MSCCEVRNCAIVSLIVSMVGSVGHIILGILMLTDRNKMVELLYMDKSDFLSGFASILLLVVHLVYIVVSCVVINDIIKEIKRMKTIFYILSLIAQFVIILFLGVHYDLLYGTLITIVNIIVYSLAAALVNMTYEQM